MKPAAEGDGRAGSGLLLTARHQDASNGFRSETRRPRSIAFLSTVARHVGNTLTVACAGNAQFVGCARATICEATSNPVDHAVIWIGAHATKFDSPARASMPLGLCRSGYGATHGHAATPATRSAPATALTANTAARLLVLRNRDATSSPCTRFSASLSQHAAPATSPRNTSNGALRCRRSVHPTSARTERSSSRATCTRRARQ